MRPTAMMRRSTLAAVVAAMTMLGACSASDDEAEPTTTVRETTTTASTLVEISLADAFAGWFNQVTAGDAADPVCDPAPEWLRPDDLTGEGSGPLLACVESGPADSLRVLVRNNSSSPVRIGFDEGSAAWQADVTDARTAIGLPRGSGVIVRPGQIGALSVARGSWTEQRLVIDYLDRWTVIEATDFLIGELVTDTDIDDRIEWATGIAESCGVESVAANASGPALATAVDAYLVCVVDELGDAADADDRAGLPEIGELVTDLVERTRNQRSQQLAGVVRSDLSFAAAPDPAGPQITEAPATTLAPVTVKPTVAQPATPKPTTTPSTTSTTRPPSTTRPVTTPSTTLPTTSTTGVITVPLPPAPTLVALEVLPGGADTYTGWPAVAPALARLSGGTIVVVECRVFTDTDLTAGNGWWYRIGSGASVGGWASATRFDNLVPDLAGPTDPANVSDTLSTC